MTSIEPVLTHPEKPNRYVTRVTNNDIYWRNSRRQGSISYTNLQARGWTPWGVLDDWATATGLTARHLLDEHYADGSGRIWRVTATLQYGTILLTGTYLPYSRDLAPGLQKIVAVEDLDTHWVHCEEHIVDGGPYNIGDKFLYFDHRNRGFGYATVTCNGGSLVRLSPTLPPTTASPAVASRYLNPCTDLEYVFDDFQAAEGYGWTPVCTIPDPAHTLQPGHMLRDSDGTLWMVASHSGRDSVIATRGCELVALHVDGDGLPDGWVPASTTDAIDLKSGHMVVHPNQPTACWVLGSLGSTDDPLVAIENGTGDVTFYGRVSALIQEGYILCGDYEGPGDTYLRLGDKVRINGTDTRVVGTWGSMFATPGRWHHTDDLLDGDNAPLRNYYGDGITLGPAYRAGKAPENRIHFLGATPRGDIAYLDHKQQVVHVDLDGGFDPDIWFPYQDLDLEDTGYIGFHRGGKIRTVDGSILRIVACDVDGESVLLDNGDSTWWEKVSDLSTEEGFSPVGSHPGYPRHWPIQEGDQVYRPDCGPCEVIYAYPWFLYALDSENGIHKVPVKSKTGKPTGGWIHYAMVGTHPTMKPGQYLIHHDGRRLPLVQINKSGKAVFDITALTDRERRVFNAATYSSRGLPTWERYGWRLTGEHDTDADHLVFPGDRIINSSGATADVLGTHPGGRILYRIRGARFDGINHLGRWHRMCRSGWRLKSK